MKHTCYALFVLCLTLLLLFASCTSQEQEESTVSDTSPATQPAQTLDVGADSDTHTEPITEEESLPSPIDTHLPETSVPADSNADAETLPAEPDPKALMETLSSSIYTSPSPLLGVAGFGNPSNVGIVESQMNEIRYPAPADSECAKVFRVADYGVTPENADNSPALRALIAEAAECEGIKKIVFSEGVYRFSETVYFRNLSDLYVCGETENTPYTFLMTQWTPGIEISGCRNIHFNGFTFDYEIPTAITGSVVDSDVGARTVTILVDEPYDLTYSGYNGGRVSYGSYMEFFYDEAADVYTPDYDGNLWYNSTGDGIRNIRDGVYDPATRQLTLSFSSIKPVKEGTRVNVAYTMYEYFGFYASDCKDLYMEGVTFNHTAGMTMGANYVENISVNRMRITPPAGSDRLMTATADCLHFGSCTGKITVSNSYFSHSHDDTMNVKGAYVKVQASDAQAIVYDPGTGTLDVKIGDTLDAYEVATFRYLGSWTVTGMDSATHTYTVAEAITEDLVGALLCNASTSPSLTVENCFIGDKRNRGMLIQCREVLIQNCTFRNVLHGAIQILSVADIFAEGIMPRNVTVTNCKFLNNTVTDVDIFTWGPAGTSSGTITGVRVSHNFFFNSDSYAVHMLGAGQSSVTGNLFCDVNRGKAVHIRISEDITISDNYAYFTSNLRKSIYSIEKSCENVSLSGNIIEAKNGFVEETET